MADGLSPEQREVATLMFGELCEIRRALADALQAHVELVLAIKVEVTALQAVLMSRGLVTEAEMAAALKKLSGALAIEWACGGLQEIERYQVALAWLRGAPPGEGADPAPLG